MSPLYTHTPLLLSVDSIIVHQAAPGVKMTSLLFARGTDCIVVGDSDGQVTFYELKNLNMGEGKQVKLRRQVCDSLFISIVILFIFLRVYCVFIWGRFTEDTCYFKAKQTGSWRQVYGAMIYISVEVTEMLLNSRLLRVYIPFYVR